MNIPGKRIWLISDTHLGVRSNSREWMEIIEDYFYKFLMPLIKENFREGDILVHCGDIFESRQSINLFVMNKALQIFEDLSAILPVYMIVGNHDIFMKYTNDVNSLKIFKKYQNITVFEEPHAAMINGKKCFFMPWRDSHESEAACLEANSGDYLFCHTDVKGFAFNRMTRVEEGCEIDSYSSYQKVYSGHIHYAQKYKNVRMVGCPYELTRSDSGNTKHVWLLDLETDTETSFENVISPRFIKMKLENVLEMKVEDLQRIFNNNFVDILVDATWSMKFPFGKFIEKFTGYKKINYIITTTQESEDSVIDEDAESEEINLLALIGDHINTLPYSEGVKEKLRNVSHQMYADVLKSLQERKNYTSEA